MEFEIIYDAKDWLSDLAVSITPANLIKDAQRAARTKNGLLFHYAVDSKAAAHVRFAKAIGSRRMEARGDRLGFYTTIQNGKTKAPPTHHVFVNIAHKDNAAFDARLKDDIFIDMADVAIGKGASRAERSRYEADYVLNAWLAKPNVFADLSKPFDEATGQQRSRSTSQEEEAAPVEEVVEAPVEEAPMEEEPASEYNPKLRIEYFEPTPIRVADYLAMAALFVDVPSNVGNIRAWLASANPKVHPHLSVIELEKLKPSDLLKYRVMMRFKTDEDRAYIKTVWAIFRKDEWIECMKQFASNVGDRYMGSDNMSCKTFDTGETIHDNAEWQALNCKFMPRPKGMMFGDNDRLNGAKPMMSVSVVNVITADEHAQVKAHWDHAVSTTNFHRPMYRVMDTWSQLVCDFITVEDTVPLDALRAQWTDVQWKQLYAAIPNAFTPEDGSFVLITYHMKRSVYHTVLTAMKRVEAQRVMSVVPEPIVSAAPVEVPEPEPEPEPMEVVQSEPEPVEVVPEPQQKKTKKSKPAVNKENFPTTFEALKPLAEQTLANSEAALQGLKDELRRMSGKVVDSDYRVDAAATLTGMASVDYTQYSLDPTVIVAQLPVEESSSDSDTGDGGEEVVQEEEPGTFVPLPQTPPRSPPQHVNTLRDQMVAVVVATAVEQKRKQDEWVSKQALEEAAAERARQAAADAAAMAQAAAAEAQRVAAEAAAAKQADQERATQEAAEAAAQRAEAKRVKYAADVQKLAKQAAESKRAAVPGSNEEYEALMQQHHWELRLKEIAAAKEDEARLEKLRLQDEEQRKEFLARVAELAAEERAAKELKRKREEEAAEEEERAASETLKRARAKCEEIKRLREADALAAECGNMEHGESLKRARVDVLASPDWTKLE